MDDHRPRYLELSGILVIGTLHVLIELITGSLVASRIYNASAGILVIGYLIACAVRAPSVFRQWGLRLDNFWRAAKCQARFVIPAVIAMLVCGWMQGARSVPPTFWLALAVYVLWGTAQQFALQNLLVRNLCPLIPHFPLCAFLSALIFGLSHIPRLELVGLAMFAGFLLTLGYRRHENIWVAGAAHGLLGAIAFYALLGKDPGAIILQTIIERVSELE